VDPEDVEITVELTSAPGIVVVNVKDRGEVVQIELDLDVGIVRYLLRMTIIFKSWKFKLHASSDS